MYIDDPSLTEVPLLLPMVKSVVRAMDTVQEFSRGHLDLDISGFAISGSSKRGWTTWLTAAVDNRVVAFCPIVFSMINIMENMHHYYRSYGGWPEAFAPYYNEGITKFIGNNPERLAEIFEVIDPYAFRERLSMPKLLMQSTNDEFFMVDDF